MATVEFRYDPKNTAWFTANAAMVLKAGEPAYHDTTGLFKLGDGVTALSALSFLPTVSASTPTIQQVLTAGQVATTTIETTGFIKTGGLSTQFLKADGTVDSTVYGVGNALTTNPLSQFAATTSSQLAGVISDETGSGALVFGTSPTFTTSIFSPLVNGASTASGTLTLASTSNATKGVIQIGTTDLVNIGNKTTTSQRLVRIGQDTAWIDIGSQSGSTARPAIYLNTTTPDTTNYALSSHQTAGQTYLNGKNGVNFLANGGIIATWIASQAAFLVQPANGNTINYQFTVPNNTALTASTEVPIFKIIGGNNTWNTGAITNQKWSWITANTANFSAASIITNSYSLFVESSISGTNSTITNNYAAGFDGDVRIVGNGVGTTNPLRIQGYVSAPASLTAFYTAATPSATNYNIVFDPTYTIVGGTVGSYFRVNNVTTMQVLNTGIKIGLTTSQTIGFWNATPIVQPTTAVASATVVSGAGGTVKHDDTFDGYTVEKVVRALRNIGLLA